MNIIELQKIGFPEMYYNDLDVHHDFVTVRLPTVNIDAQISLTIFSPGANIDEGVSALVATGIASYKFIDSDGEVKLVEFDHWTNWVRVEKCVEVTFALVSRKCWAKAEGMIFHWK